MSVSLGFEILMSLLLVITICYCFILDRKLKALRSGQDGVRQSISDMVQATLQAEQCITNLRSSAEQVGQDLEARIIEAKSLQNKLARPTTPPRMGRIPAAGNSHNNPSVPAATTVSASGIMDRLKRAG